MPRGGRRQGAPGQSYGQRTDLNQAPSGGQYGDRVASERRMQAVPITPTHAPPSAQLPAQQAPPPTAPGPLDRPTDRPDEPITAGLPTGPGPGPEVLGLDGPNPDIAAMGEYLPMLERLASLPSSSVATRNLVRRLRGGL